MHSAQSACVYYIAVPHARAIALRHIYHKRGNKYCYYNIEYTKQDIKIGLCYTVLVMTCILTITQAYYE